MLEQLNMQFTPGEADWTQPTYSVSYEKLQGTLEHGITEQQVDNVNNELATIQHSHDAIDQKDHQFQVMIDGRYNSKPVGLQGRYNRNAQGTLNDRLWMSHLIHESAEVADTIAQAEVAGFHATSSVTLAGLLEGGSLLSGRELDKIGKAVTAGAHDATVGSRDISFGALSHTKQNIETYGGTEKTQTTEELLTELQDQIALNQEIMKDAPTPKMIKRGTHIIAGLEQVITEVRENPNTLAATLMRNRFPIAIGVSRDFIERAEPYRQAGDFFVGQSYMGEFRPASEIIPLKDLPVIGVPAAQVEPVQRLFALFGREQTKIVPLETLKAATPDTDYPQ